MYDLMLIKKSLNRISAMHSNSKIHSHRIDCDWISFKFLDLKNRYTELLEIIKIENEIKNKKKLLNENWLVVNNNLKIVKTISTKKKSPAKLKSFLLNKGKRNINKIEKNAGKMNVNGTPKKWNWLEDRPVKYAKKINGNNNLGFCMTIKLPIEK